MQEIIYLVHAQNFPISQNFLPLIDTCTSAYQGVKNVSFESIPNG